MPDHHTENKSQSGLAVLLPLGDVQGPLFHTSPWHLSVSEQTILVVEVSKLIESEIIRVSCFPWKSQNLKGDLKRRMAFKHNMLCWSKTLVLTNQLKSFSTIFPPSLPSLPWGAEQSSMNRDSLMQLSGMPLTSKRCPSSTGQHTLGSRSWQPFFAGEGWHSRKISIPFRMSSIPSCKVQSRKLNWLSILFL